MQNHDTSHRILGPVADLERHLPPEWWRTLLVRGVSGAARGAFA
jgi:hypothetical protein